VTPKISNKRVLLLIMPFLTLRRPHLGVALLKAGLHQAGIGCDVRYFNFRFADIIGAALYDRIAENSPSHHLAGEFIFTSALYGEDACPFEDFKVSVADYLRPYPDDFLRQLERCRNLAPIFIQECANQIDLGQYDIVGFTSTFQQNMASLALARELKRRSPAITTVFGGSNFEAEMGVELHRHFPFIDVVCSGEADLVFPEVVRRIRAGESLLDLGGLTCRHQGGSVTSSTPQTVVSNLNDLPYPDHDDYFRAFQTSTASSVVVPEMTMETSRGCWWGQKHHCTFCGLNGLSMTFRSKSPDRAYSEIKHLLSTYGSYDIFNTDNIVDLRYFNELFPRIAADGVKMQLFYETKSNLKKSQLLTFKKVGSREFQPGIESLNSHVLTLMDKGVKGIQNVQLLRWAREMDFNVSWNIICGFPGEQPEDYQQIIRWIRAVPHLQPPVFVTRFRLDRFSPMFKDPVKYGITNIRSSPAHRLCYPFPEESLQRLTFYLDCDPPILPETMAEIRTMWRSVDEWKNIHSSSSLAAEVTPTALVLHDRREGFPAADYRYSGLARALYLAADGVHSDSFLLEYAASQFPDQSFTLEDIHKVLRGFVERDLMLQEDNLYLSLALLPLEESVEVMPPHRPEAASTVAVSRIS
jgi:ribosomal peptide maturation radical SAM protein 1